MCPCPIDWICCLNADCPRGARIRFEQERRMIEARKVLGDPMKAVTLGMPTSDKP